MTPNLHATIATDSSVVLVPFEARAQGSLLRLGINVHKVDRVTDATDLKPLPPAFHPFTATLSHAGVPVPVLDLSLFLNGQKTDDASRTRRVLICHMQDLWVGILVERTRKLERYPSEAVLPAPDMLRCHGINPFMAAVPRGDDYTYLLDIETILSHLGVRLEEARPTGTSKDFEGKRILVVEDSRFFQRRCREVLEQHGAIVEVAPDGRAGLAAIERAGGRFDLIFSDIEMPYMNGIQMVQMAKQRFPDLCPVIFNSGINNPAIIDEITRSGLGDYLVKFSENDFLEAVRRTFGKMAA